MSLIKRIKFPNEAIYDIGSKWSNIDKENIIYNSSNIISFNTEQEKLLKSCLVNIEPVQEGVGEPSPSNIRPITGWTGAKIYSTGKNLLPPMGTEDTLVSGVQWTVNGDGTFYSQGISESANSQPYQSEFDLPPGTYYLSGCPTGGASNKYFLRVLRYKDTTLLDSATDTGSGASFTVTGEETRMLVFANHNASITSKILWKPQVEVGSTATVYEPYKKTLDFTFPSEAGTIYGGTLDVLTGVLTVTHAMVDLGSCAFSLKQPWEIDGTFQTNIPDITKNRDAAETAICSRYANSWATSHTPQEVYNGSFVGFCIRLDYPYVAFYDPNLAGKTVSEVQAALAGQKLVYPLATPTTYQLTSQVVTTLAGQNHIWADTGNIAVVLEEFYSDFQNELTINLNENKLLYKNSNAITSSNHSITTNKLGINSEILDDYTLHINGNTLTNHDIVLQKSNDISWSSSGSNNEPAFIMKGANDKDFKFKFSTSGHNVDVGWDWTTMAGSGAFFRNIDTTETSDRKGVFGFFARKPNTTTPTTADCSELYGFPSGLLYWKKTSGDSTPQFAVNATSASTYTLYVNGPSYTKGNLDIGATSGSTKCSLQYNNTLNTLNFVFD